MGLQWIKESNPVWDEGKQRIVGKAPAGIFDRRYAELESDQLVPGGGGGRRRTVASSATGGSTSSGETRRFFLPPIRRHRRTVSAVSSSSISRVKAGPAASTISITSCDRLTPTRRKSLRGSRNVVSRPLRMGVCCGSW